MRAFNELDQLAYKLQQERTEREAARESLQLKARAIAVPAYDNTDLHTLERWTARNLDALAGYFQSLGVESDEIRVCTVIQYERQLALREIAPHVAEWDEREQRKRRRSWQEVAADAAGVPAWGEL